MAKGGAFSKTADASGVVVPTIPPPPASSTPPPVSTDWRADLGINPDHYIKS